MADNNVIGWEEYLKKRDAAATRDAAKLVAKKDIAPVFKEKTIDELQAEIDRLEGLYPEAVKAAKNSKKKGKKEFDDLDSAFDYYPPATGKGSDFYGTDNYWKGTKTGKGAAIVTTPRCYVSHKPLKIGEYLIYGGSCSAPAVVDADIYVGFEHGMKQSPKSYPWVDGASFSFLIVDGNVPTSIEDTMQLLEFLASSLKAGKKVHLGCIGGHGRTGTILSALVCYMTGNKNATEYVRTNYCEKAVESVTQINWLYKNFGIEKVKPSKIYGTTAGQGSFGFGGKGTAGVSKNYSEMSPTRSAASNGSYVFFETIKPVRVKGNIFGF